VILLCLLVSTSCQGGAAPTIQSYGSGSYTGPLCAVYDEEYFKSGEICTSCQSSINIIYLVSLDNEAQRMNTLERIEETSFWFRLYINVNYQIVTFAPAVFGITLSDTFTPLCKGIRSDKFEYCFLISIWLFCEI
jgi:hypothetical protein